MPCIRLGHRSIEVTHRTYGHLEPSAIGRARTADAPPSRRFWVDPVLTTKAESRLANRILTTKNRKESRRDIAFCHDMWVKAVGNGGSCMRLALAKHERSYLFIRSRSSRNDAARWAAGFGKRTR